MGVNEGKYFFYTINPYPADIFCPENITCWYNVNCIYSTAFQINLISEANTMNPDQTAP